MQNRYLQVFPQYWLCGMPLGELAQVTICFGLILLSRGGRLFAEGHPPQGVVHLSDCPEGRLTATGSSGGEDNPAVEHVILLHGLIRNSDSLSKIEAALIEADFSTDNRDYPSRQDSIRNLADSTIGEALARPEARRAKRVHFVTHSMGGILVRDYLSRNECVNLGRVVMLAPPNQGSEVIDRIGHWPIVGWLNGPSGDELGTGPDSLPNRLGPVNYPVGVIAGDRSINWINSMILPGPDDGKVTVERTKVEGMADHLVVHATHPMIMRNETVIAQTLHFLRAGRFEPADG